MSVITDTTNIINQLYPDYTFVLSSKFQANVKSFFEDASNFPMIILDNELSKEGEIKKNNNVQKNSKIVITFLNLDSLDNTDAQSEVIRAAMEVLADKAAVQLYQLLPVRPIIGNQKYKLTPAFHIFNSNLTGVILEMLVNYNEIVNFKI